MITHLQPDLLECEVKWALESITTSKASGGDGIPVELFQILKDDAVKELHSICQQIWKTQQWHRAGKGQFSFQFQRKAMPKNAQTAAQLHSSHTLVKKCSKFSKPGFSNTGTVKFLMFKLVLEKAEEKQTKNNKTKFKKKRKKEKAAEPEIKLPTSAGSSKKQESSRKNIYFCFID